MYTMKETCEKVNMTYETLKYYCNQNLVPNLKRDKNNYRIFDERNIAWLEGLQCLRKAGMSVKDMKQYMEYCLEGKKTIQSRKAMLENTKRRLVDQIDNLKDSLKYIEEKQIFYDEVLSGKREYKSNIIDV